MLRRLRIVASEGTTSLNLGLSRFQTSPNGRLPSYSTDGTQITRPFTAADSEIHGELWTPVIPTNDLILELTVPRKERRLVDLQLGSIDQGYRGFGTSPADPYLKSGRCSLDVECLAAGDTWREEMRSVAAISTGDFTCTAAAPCAAIHHPNTDEKRITYVTTNPATTSYNTPSSPGDGTHIRAHWATDPPGPFTTPGVTVPGRRDRHGAAQRPDRRLRRLPLQLDPGERGGQLDPRRYQRRYGLLDQPRSAGREPQVNRLPAHRPPVTRLSNPRGPPPCENSFPLE